VHVLVLTIEWHQLLIRKIWSFQGHESETIPLYKPEIIPFQNTPVTNSKDLRFSTPCLCTLPACGTVRYAVWFGGQVQQVGETWCIRPQNEQKAKRGLFVSCCFNQSSAPGPSAQYINITYLFLFAWLFWLEYSHQRLEGHCGSPR